MIDWALVVVHVVVSLLLMLLILLHSGRGTGLSDVFGGGGGALGGAGQIERNLDRFTVVASVIFAITTVALGLRWSA